MSFRIGHTVEVTNPHNHNFGKTGTVTALYGVLSPFNKYQVVVSINGKLHNINITSLKRVRIEPTFDVNDEVTVATSTHPMNGSKGVVVQKWHSGGRSQYLVVDGNYGIFDEDELI